MPLTAETAATAATSPGPVSASSVALFVPEDEEVSVEFVPVVAPVVSPATCPREDGVVVEVLLVCPADEPVALFELLEVLVGVVEEEPAVLFVGVEAVFSVLLPALSAAFLAESIAELVLFLAVSAAVFLDGLRQKISHKISHTMPATTSREIISHTIRPKIEGLCSCCSYI